jgi:hypothetical protein
MRCARLLALCLVLSASSAARADEIQLRGGAKIEGKARREGDTVVIRVESGEIRLPADSVEHIRKAESSEEIAERRRAALGPRDVRGRLELASYCRAHELRATERTLLQEVLEINPDHPQARRLLGYERDATQPGRGWVDRSHQQQEARAAEENAWLERQRAQERELARAQAEREQQNAQAETLRARDEALRARDEALRARDDAFYAPGYFYYPAYARAYRHDDWQRESCGPDRDCSAPPSAPHFPIAGVRHPRDTSFFLVGVKDPHESLRSRSP